MIMDTDSLEKPVNQNPAEKIKDLRIRKRRRIAAFTAAAVFCLIWLFLRTGQVTWTADYIAYSGYDAGEHVKEFKKLQDAALIFRDIRENSDGSVSLTMNALQRLYYRYRYKRMLSQAEEDCRELGIGVKVGGDYRSIKYYADSFQDYFDASLACARTETFASCLQMERNSGDGKPWSLEITICRGENPDAEVASFIIPEGNVNVTPQMWENEGENT